MQLGQLTEYSAAASSPLTACKGSIRVPTSFKARDETAVKFVSHRPDQRAVALINTLEHNRPENKGGGWKAPPGNQSDRDRKVKKADQKLSVCFKINKSVFTPIHLVLIVLVFLLLPVVKAASAPTGMAQKYMGTGNNAFAGEGDTLGNGGTVSVYEPYSVSSTR